MMDIGTEENPIMVPARRDGGRILLMARASDKWEIDAALAAFDLTVSVDDESRPAAGVQIDMVGQVELTPAVFDGVGDIVAPAVVDDWVHCNILIAEPALSALNDDGKLKWVTFLRHWAENANAARKRNADEEGTVLLDVTLIDPDTIRSPSRVFL